MLIIANYVICLSVADAQLQAICRQCNGCPRCFLRHEKLSLVKFMLVAGLAHGAHKCAALVCSVVAACVIDVYIMLD